MLKIGHNVTVPETLRGPNPKAGPETIPIPEELETVPGIPQDPDTVNFYTRNYPVEAFPVEHSAWVTYLMENTDIKEAFDEHLKLDRPNVKASRESGDKSPR